MHPHPKLLRPNVTPETLTTSQSLTSFKSSKTRSIYDPSPSLTSIHLSPFLEKLLLNGSDQPTPQKERSTNTLLCHRTSRPNPSCRCASVPQLQLFLRSPLQRFSTRSMAGTECRGGGTNDRAGSRPAESAGRTYPTRFSRRKRGAPPDARASEQSSPRNPTRSCTLTRGTNGGGGTMVRGERPRPFPWTVSAGIAPLTDIRDAEVLAYNPEEPRNARPRSRLRELHRRAIDRHNF